MKKRPKQVQLRRAISVSRELYDALKELAGKSGDSVSGLSECYLRKTIGMQDREEQAVARSRLRAEVQRAAQRKKPKYDRPAFAEITPLPCQGLPVPVFSAARLAG